MKFPFHTNKLFECNHCVKIIHLFTINVFFDVNYYLIYGYKWKVSILTKKCTKAEKSKRVVIVYDKLLSGFSRADIIQYMIENYKISESQIDKYIKEANQLISIDLKNNRLTGLNYRLL